MMGRDQKAENVVTFAVKEHPTTVERPTCKHYGRRGHTEDDASRSSGIL